MSSSVKFILVGCGSIGSGVHMPSLLKLREEQLVEIVGVVDVTPSRAEAISKKFSVAKWGTDWQLLARETGAQALSVCLPPGPNVNVCVGALEAGLHVMSEKPPGRNVQDAERMAAAASLRPNLVTLVAFNRRFAPLYIRTRESAERLGSPKTFYGRFTRSGLGSGPSDTADDWITSDASHSLDLAVATIGYPHSIGVSRALVGSDRDNVWTLQLHADKGTAVLVFDFAAGRRVERFEFSGPGYDALLELPDRGEWAQQGREPELWNARELTGTDSPVTNYGYLGEYRAFVSAIRGAGPRPECDFNYAVDYMRLVKEILDCPTGKLRSVTRSGLPRSKTQVAPDTRTPLFRGERIAKGRQVVTIWQSPAAQNRFFSQQSLSSLRELCDLRLRSENEPLEKDIGQTQALILGWEAPALTPELIKQASQLEVVIVIGASVKHAYPELLLDRGILLCSTSDAIAESVSEHCLLGALAGLRQLTMVDREMHAGKWPSGPTAAFSLRKSLKRWEHLPLASSMKPLVRPLLNKISPPPARRAISAPSLPWSDLRGQTVGLVGWGHIARHFARLLMPFDCPLLVNSEAARPEELVAYNARPASLGEIFAGSRVISLHKGMTKETKGLIGPIELAMIRPGSVFINTSRGPIVDEQALLDRLRRGDVVAVIDVFNQEPLPPKHPLRALPNVILTPHNSSTTRECFQRVGKQALNMVHDWISEKNVPSITAAKLERMT